jgi:hypothetical protein
VYFVFNARKYDGNDIATEKAHHGELFRAFGTLIEASDRWLGATQVVLPEGLR